MKLGSWRDRPFLFAGATAAMSSGFYIGTSFIELPVLRVSAWVLALLFGVNLVHVVSGQSLASIIYQIVRITHALSAQASIAEIGDGIHVVVSKTSSIDSFSGVINHMAPKKAGAPVLGIAGRRVFVVHGWQEAAREMVARFLEKLGLEAIILSEQANTGYTIVEKFEQVSDVAYAIVLLTGDDQGAVKGTPLKKHQLRARQNVIFELGFFLGRIGRQRVCALYEPGVEIPCDFKGVVYIELDQQRRWQLDVAKELKAAGLPVDLNVLL